MRFVVAQEPSETWAVFDQILDLPAEFAGQSLVGLTRDDADRFAAMANNEILRWRPTSGSTATSVSS